MLKKLSVVIFLGIVLVLFIAAGPNAPLNNGMGAGFDFVSIKDQLISMPKQALSSDEISGLLIMREEEKLARDVYFKLYELWKVQIFLNISKSEQTHMDTVKILLDKYNIDDPVKEDVKGKFVNQELQKLYNELIEIGSKSYKDALVVGMIIEDLDIADLQSCIQKTDNEDIKAVYKNLMKGSRNHMRSFYRNLKNIGGDYTPQHITKEEFEAIISTSIERGPVK
ncbi:MULTISPECIES: DUF2202 domain-containing protein [unclassified Thermosipho (in: thermotogales)]|uniref:DUF2202 domain-containing protein n=1 Tax=unclassified Thermosipho (in: thermotogales) TaxID=2676525 RepID=UPI000984D77D|nr:MULTISPECIES: DUF2202 domain-containing protein [unclassified Thermosipho (in: thermotogales)]